MGTHIQQKQSTIRLINYTSLNERELLLCILHKVFRALVTVFFSPAVRDAAEDACQYEEVIARYKVVDETLTHVKGYSWSFTLRNQSGSKK